MELNDLIYAVGGFGAFDTKERAQVIAALRKLQAIEEASKMPKVK